MNLDEIIFLDRLPKLDLHGYDRQTARVAIDDFIRDNVKMKHQFCVIVHGIGSGVILRTTQETLRDNRHILQYRIHHFNSGCTIVQLRFDKMK